MKPISSLPVQRFYLCKSAVLAVLILLMVTGCLLMVACAQPGTTAEVEAEAESDQELDSEAVALISEGEQSNESEKTQKEAYDAHAKLFEKERYPSATSCGECHPTHYREWSGSQHAYAQMSPIFNAMFGKINKLTNGTNGDFCVRCHTQVGMNLGESEFMSNIDRHPTSREGISCVVCHRVAQPYGKLSGRFHLKEGPVTEPIYGPTGNETELEKSIEAGGLVTDPTKTGRKIHGALKRFFQITTSGFCGSCHDVTLVNGFRLEEAFSEFKSSPAAARGIQCQDCHMGKEPGKVLAERTDPSFFEKNYNFGPAAVVSGKQTAPRKLTNHKFHGPDYSVLEPSLFPLNIRAIKEESQKNDKTARGMATIREWLEFDWRAGWGTDEFEDNVADDYKFPPRWASVDDRYDARDIIEENLKLLKEMEIERKQILRVGYILGDIKMSHAGPDGIKFSVQVRNGTDGHNVPTGFDAERLVWLYVRVMDADGKIVHQSGDLDPNGDVRDLHSAYVHNHELPLDEELFSLQSKFMVRMLRGGEREQVLAVNSSPNPLPFLRPETMSPVLQGRPAGARKHKMGIEPLGERWSTYTVKRSQLENSKPPYKALVQLKAAMVPVNLVNEIRDVGFDYNMSARQIADNLVKGYVDKDDKVIIWNKENKDPEANRVIGHQVIWEKVVDFNTGESGG